MSQTQSGFAARSVYKVRQPKVLHLAKQKLSFMIAAFSLFAFVAGNMVGQHGWYAFWKTVFGKEDDAMIAFVGTVPPIARVPDYAVWAQYGGNKQAHAFNQVPEVALRDLPPYDPSALAAGTASDLAKQTYSTLWAGGYSSPYGSHGGVDIDAPHGTPVVAVANGIVDKVVMDSVGFGHYVLIRHPNSPVADGDSKTSTLYSTYAHLDQVDVIEGQVLHKGELIGTVGNTGTVFGATGYHLYFQIEKASAPFHPYWPFTSDDTRQYGMSFVQAVNSTVFRGNVLSNTLSPMVFVADFATYTAQAVARTTNGSSGVNAQTSVANASSGERMKLLAAARAARRGARIAVAQVQSSASSSVQSQIDSSVQPSAAVVVTDVKTVSVDSVAPVPSGGVGNDVDHLSIDTSGKLMHAWQKIRINALNKNGEPITSPSFSGRLYIISDFGEAVIRPSELGPLDFVNGTATVNVLARGSKTLFISTRGAFNATSGPMIFDR